LDLTLISGERDAHMNRIILTALLCLFAGPGHATFEIKDPAAEAMSELDKDANEADILVCSNFVSSRKTGSDAYWSALTWLVEYMDAADAGLSADYDPDVMARWIDDYCIRNPGDSLGIAAEAFVKTSL
jgi:hypothetical protein